MENLFYIKGQEIKHSMYFGTSKGKSVELIGSISDWELKRFDTQNIDKKGVQICPSLDLVSGEISLYTTWVLVSEYRVADEKETELFNKKFADKNLTFENRKCIRVNHIYKEEEQYNLVSTYYKSKDDFRIVLGDKVVTYKELKNMQFADDDKIVLSGDNGYSHCWESTIKLDSVFDYIDCLFNVPSIDKQYKDNSRAFQSLAKVGEHWGYKFNQYGELVLRVTKKNINVSMVSNS